MDCSTERGSPGTRGMPPTSLYEEWFTELPIATAEDWLFTWAEWPVVGGAPTLLKLVAMAASNAPSFVERCCCWCAPIALVLSKSDGGGIKSPMGVWFRLVCCC